MGKRNRYFGIVCIGMGSVIFAYLLPLLWLYPWKLKDLTESHPIREAGVVVILEGTFYSRIDYAFSIVEKGLSSVIYFPSPVYEQNIAYISEKIDELRPDQECFIGPSESSSTYNEARKTKDFLKEHPEYSDVLLVTSPYHSYRAWWIFSNVLKGYNVISAPVPYEVPWKINGNIDKTHRHVRYAHKERRKFLASYILYGWLFQCYFF